MIVSVLEQLSSQIRSDGIVGEELMLQVCDNRTARYSLGVVVNTQSNLSSVQLAIQSLKNGSCLSAAETRTWQNVTFYAPSLSSSTASNSTSSRRVKLRSERAGKRLSARSDCSTVQVQSGDTCKVKKKIRDRLLIP